VQKIYLFIIVVVSIVTLSCGAKKQEEKKILIGDVNIKLKVLENIDQKKVDGSILGADFKRKHVYIRELLPENRNHIIRLVDITNGKVVQRVPLRAGDFQSPDEFSEPTHIQYLDGKYYIFDHNDKIVVFDDKFHRLNSSMIHGSRSFVDFYNEGESIFFLLGRRRIKRKNLTCNALLYRLEKSQRPVEESKIFTTDQPSAWALHDKKHYYVGFFWPNCWGFEKDGEIYYSDNQQKKYYLYDLKTREKTAFELPYLKENSFSAEDAQKLGNYKNPLWPKKMKHKVVYIKSKQPVYHFGLFDVGEKKIGLIAEIDVDKLTFRMDVLNSLSGKYLWSIKLPFGEGFMRMISTGDSGFLRHHINLDEGYYLWSDVDEENMDAHVLINRFRIRE